MLIIGDTKKTLNAGSFCWGGKKKLAAAAALAGRAEVVQAAVPTCSGQLREAASCGSSKQ